MYQDNSSITKKLFVNSSTFATVQRDPYATSIRKKGEQQPFQEMLPRDASANLAKLHFIKCCPRSL